MPADKSCFFESSLFLCGGQMKDLLQQIAFLPPGVRLAIGVLGILVIYAAARLLVMTLPRYFGRADSRYHVRKFVAFAGYVIAILMLLLLFEDRLGRLSLALGVAGAG